MVLVQVDDSGFLKTVFHFCFHFTAIAKFKRRSFKDGGRKWRKREEDFSKSLDFIDDDKYLSHLEGSKSLHFNERKISEEECLDIESDIIV